MSTKISVIILCSECVINTMHVCEIEIDIFYAVRCITGQSDQCRQWNVKNEMCEPLCQFF